MRRYQPPVDEKWCRHIFDTFLSVLQRPRFEIKVDTVSTGEPILGPRKTIIMRARIWYMNEKLHIFGIQSQNFAIHCGDARKFRFQATFTPSRPQKVRKVALIFVQKLKQKVIYDVMKA